MSTKNILIVDDHKNIRLTLRMTLEDEGCKITEAESCAEASKNLGDIAKNGCPFDLILCDIRLPDGSGLDLLRKISDAGYGARVIMISGEGTVAEAFQATQLGAFDFLEKPFSSERITVCVRRALEFLRIQNINKNLSSLVNKGQELSGDHPKLRDIISLVKRVAPTNGRVLISGESGTGKELVARAIHRYSQRSDRPMIKINCAAIPDNLIESELFGHERGSFTGAIKQRAGVFERAHGATLFLDEIGELDLSVQAKLLRVLQSGEFNRVGGEKTLTSDVRIIAATNRDLQAMVAQGDFREDLYFRLNVVTIQTPPLRERPSDIPVLASIFLQEACTEHSLGVREFSEHAVAQLIAYPWPGNVRELKNVVERAAILSEDALIDHFDELSGVASSAGVQPTVEASEGNQLSQTLRIETPIMAWNEFHDFCGREFLKFALRQAGGNVSETSRVLQLERAYLHRLMKKLGIQRTGGHI